MEIDDDIYESSHSGSSFSEKKALDNNRGKAFIITSDKGMMIEHFNVGDQDIRSDS